jgi:hypothetical protein
LYKLAPAVDPTVDDTNSVSQQSLDCERDFAPLEERRFGRLVHDVRVGRDIVIQSESGTETADEQITGAIAQISQSAIELAYLGSLERRDIVR